MDWLKVGSVWVNMEKVRTVETNEKGDKLVLVFADGFRHIVPDALMWSMALWLEEHADKLRARG